jgi:hypothetical protein
VAVVAQHLDELFVQGLVGLCFGKVAAGDAVEEGEVGGGILGGSCLSGRGRECELRLGRTG